MPLFYKGVGAGTYSSKLDFRLTGLSPRAPGMTPSHSMMVGHIGAGTARSCYTSLTRSYAVARAYAFSGLVAPTSAMPGYVYILDITDPLPSGMSMDDPVSEISSQNRDTLAPHSYQHDGDQNFLLGVVDSANYGNYVTGLVLDPPGSSRGSRACYLSSDLEALVRALRDAEILVSGNIPSKCFVDRFDIF